MHRKFDNLDIRAGAFLVSLRMSCVEECAPENPHQELDARGLTRNYRGETFERIRSVLITQRPNRSRVALSRGTSGAGSGYRPPGEIGSEQ